MDILVQYMRGISKSIYTLFSQIFLILIFFMFMLLEAPSLNNKIDMAFSGSAGAKVKNIMSSITYEISSYLGGLTLIGIATGVCVWIVLAIMGVELAVGWAVLVFLLNYIPNAGAVISTIPPVIMAALQFSPGYVQPVIVLILVSAIQFVFGNVIAPKILGDKLGLSPVVIMLSLLIWGTMWGITGAILSVPIASTIKIICENFSSLRPIAILMGTGREKPL
jgi:predicted PurR-regulated permease PerM